MPEYVSSKIESILPGEKVATQIKSNPQIRIGTGLIFEDDGQYIVTVSGKRIVVEKYLGGDHDV